MSRLGVWITVCTVLCLGTWGALAWVWFDPAMQDARDAFGGGGHIIGFGASVPTTITMFSGMLMFSGSSGGGGGGGGDGGYGPGGCGAGCGGGCGGCGGGL
ncbi:hypothetical protein [Streptomyces sp. PvR034]|uniref:hypothetical protein n=1 Tax=Streptomyces sp. PvR034 TaxID=3156401 RepID=UPI003394451B